MKINTNYLCLFANNKKAVLLVLFLHLNIISTAQSVVINELNYRIEDADQQIQFIELYNTTNEAINLTDWVIEKGVYYQFPSGTILAPNAYIIIAKNVGEIYGKFTIPAGVQVMGPWQDALSTYEERVNLRDASYKLVDYITYNGWKEWPNTKGGLNSIQKMHPTLPSQYGGSWDGKSPTPGAANQSVLVANPSIVPVLKNVTNTPQAPTAGQAVKIQAYINDAPNGTTTASLEYQIVTPGNYITRNDPTYNTNWTTLQMNDNGAAGDSQANDGIYTAEIPANIQVHRRLIRYRVRVQNSNGFSKTFPDPEFDEANYAYYVYNGFPNYNGYDLEQLNDLQTIQVIADLSNTSTVTVVYNGEIYDHVDFSFQNFYNASRRNIRFNFNSGHPVSVSNDFGEQYKVKRDKMSLSGTYMNDINAHGLTESLIFKFFELNESSSSYADYVQLRIVNSADENANGNAGDFWGIYVIRDYVRYGGTGIDGDFLAQRNLPDGNIYGYKGHRVHHDGADGVSGLNNAIYTDWNNTLGDSSDGCSSCSVSDIPQTYLEDNLDLDNHYGFMIAQEFCANNETNYAGQHCYFEYYNPENQKWQIFPDDFNAAFGAPRDEVALYDRSICDPNEDVRGPLKVQLLAHKPLSIEFENRIRSAIDLLYNEEQGAFLVDNEAAKIYNPNGSYSWTDVDKSRWGQPYTDYASIVEWYKGYIESRKDYLDNLYGSGKAPNKPTIAYTGPSGFPLNQLTFQNSAFADPQGAGSFASLEWRIGEWSDPSNPVYADREDDIYEITPVWLSGAVSTFSNTFTVNGKNLKQGHTYRVRVQYTDDTGRKSRWSDPVEFVAGAPVNAPTPNIVISEIMYNPKIDCGNDFIEITNAGNSAVDLEGYYFEDGIDYTFPSGATLAPGASFVLTDDQTAFYYHYGFSPFGEYQKSLSNSGERIALHGAYDVLIDEVTYNNSWGGGSSNDALQLINIQSDNSNPNNWARVAGNCGSPNLLYSDNIIVIDDQFDIDQNTSLSGNFLANDIYPTNANIQISTMPTNGTLIFNNDSSFDYTPNDGFAGTDNFTYEICIDADIPATPTTYTAQVSSSGDDVEESNTGAIDVTSSDLEFMLEDAPQRAVGFRIQNINIPQGQILNSAYLEFTADESHADPTSLTIKAEAIGNALSIPPTNSVLTNKNKTIATTSWNNLPAWTEGISYTSPDITAVVQEIINRGDWASGNAMTFIIEGSGKRVAESFDGAAGLAPKLIVEYLPANAGQICYQATVNINVEATCVELNIQAYLEGNYSPNNDRMSTELNTSRGLLPGQTPTSALVPPTPDGQPYNIAPWNYNGTEGEDWTDADYTADDVDWVLVSFRTGTAKNTEVAMTAAVLDKFGNINFPDRCALAGDIATQVYVVVEHRNHMGIMTQQPVNITNGTLTYDFRAVDSYRDQTSFGQKQLPTGEWGMFAGDADQSDFPSFDINGPDKVLWFDTNGTFDYYLPADFNLDGDINGEDKLLWFENNGISSRVPK